ncbi:MAG: hypothetical protein QW117_02710 [Candidatus Pacearchaeota archaeon]
MLKNNKKIIRSLVFIFIVILIIFILRNFTCSFSIEKQGTNIEKLNVSFNFYIINNEINEEELVKYVSEVNKIWNNYNISILINNIYKVNLNITTEERKYLYTKISGKNSEEDSKICNEFYIPLINKITNNSPDMSIIYIKGKSINFGRGNLCGYKFVIFKKDKKCKDFTAWNLAHEIGHVLGLTDKREDNKFNLMNDRCKISKPYFLNQEQVNKTILTIKSLNKEN